MCIEANMYLGPIDILWWSFCPVDLLSYGPFVQLLTWHTYVTDPTSFVTTVNTAAELEL